MQKNGLHLIENLRIRPSNAKKWTGRRRPKTNATFSKSLALKNAVKAHDDGKESGQNFVKICITHH
jgi:hypothetical protein